MKGAVFSNSNSKSLILLKTASKWLQKRSDTEYKTQHKKQNLVRILLLILIHYLPTNSLRIRAVCGISHLQV